MAIVIDSPSGYNAHVMEDLMKRGWQWCLVVLAVVSVAAMPAFAGGKGSTSALNCKLTAPLTGPERIGPDSAGRDYNHGSTNTSVKCFLGAGGKNFDLVTYNSGRTFTFTFGAQGPAVTAGLPTESFTAEVDAYGINYYSQYLNMAVGTTAIVQMDLQFHYGGGSNTYELSYSCLAVTRTQFTTWVITSDIENYNNAPGAAYCLSSKATLNKIRRNSVQGFGEVDMPIRIEFTPQQP